MMTPYQNVTHLPSNSATMLILAAYVATVLWRGNFALLIGNLRNDFFGRDAAPAAGSAPATGKQPAFWKWAFGLIILYALASNARLNFLFGPLLMLALAAMLINIATRDPQGFSNLSSSFNAILKQ